MKSSLITLGLLWVLLGCKHKPVVKEAVSYGQVNATFNGRSWPDQNPKIFFQVSAQRFRSLCQATYPQLGKYSYTMNIAVGKQNSQEFTDEVGFGFVPSELPITRKVQSGTDAQPVNERCGLLANQISLAGFNYMFNDGFDNMSYLNYKTNNNRTNTLTITRLDTVAKVVEGRFDVSFVRNGPASKTKPDTIHIQCSRFVARLNM